MATKIDRPPASAQPRTFKQKAQAVAAMFLGVGLIHAIGRSVRFASPPEANLNSLRGTEGGPLLYAMWHGTHFPPLYHYRRRNICVVTSRSADGQILARILTRLGYHCVRGSSTRGGTQALIQLARAVARGMDAAVAIDGPRGPAQRVKPGIILLAKLTGRPIIPVASTASVFWRFQSWDRFRIPLPLSRATIRLGDPVYVPRDAVNETIEAIRDELERTLMRMQGELDAEIRPRIWRLPDRKPRDRTPLVGGRRRG